MMISHVTRLIGNTCALLEEDEWSSIISAGGPGGAETHFPTHTEQHPVVTNRWRRDLPPVVDSSTLTQ